MGGQLRYGFKAEAERLSGQLRGELGLTCSDRLDCATLADHLAVPILSLATLARSGADPRSVALLLNKETVFSALTVCAGPRKLIVYNPSHPPGRRANSLAHELSHIVLDHEPTQALGLGGCRIWNDRVEAEADWLGGALLVPREGALWWFGIGGNNDDGAEFFGVSRALMRWRTNQTGVLRQLENSRRNQDTSRCLIRSE